ncbi:MAG: STT3 domain-containing protein [Candidatus Methanomethylicia archaeon]
MVRESLLIHFKTVNKVSVLTALILMLICLISISLRAMNSIYGLYLNEYDPHFWWRCTSYILDKGFGSWFSWIDDKSWFPNGRNVSLTSYPGVPFTGAILYIVANTIGISLPLYNFLSLVPIILSTIVVILIYLTVRDVFDETSGLMAALLMATSSPYIARTNVGWFDTESVGMFALLLSIFFLVKAIKRESMLYALFSSVAGGYMSVSWGAYIYLFNLIALYILILVLIGRINKNLARIFTAYVGISVLIAGVIPYSGTSIVKSVGVAPMLMVCLLVILSTMVRPFLSRKLGKLLFVIALILFIALIYVLYIIEYLKPLTSRVLSVLNPALRGENPLLQSVGEHLVPSWISIYSDFSSLLIFAVVGLCILLRRGKNNDLLLVLYLVSASYAAASMARLNILASPAFAMLSGICISHLLKPFVKLIKMKRVLVKKRKAKTQPLDKVYGVIIIFLILFLIFSPLSSGIKVSGSPQQIVSGGLSTLREVPDWMETLVWIQDNTPPDSVIIAWWDYGYWITSYTNRTTCADNATLNSTQIKQIAKMFMSNEIEAVEIIKKLVQNKRLDRIYILIFSPLSAVFPNQGSSKYTLGGDEAKWFWMARIANISVNSLVDKDIMKSLENLAVRGLNLTLPDRERTLLGKLLIYGSYAENHDSEFATWYSYMLVYYGYMTTPIIVNKPTFFDLVYRSSNRIVLVFKLNLV